MSITFNQVLEQYIENKHQVIGGLERITSGFEVMSIDEIVEWGNHPVIAGNTCDTNGCECTEFGVVFARSVGHLSKTPYYYAFSGGRVYALSYDSNFSTMAVGVCASLEDIYASKDMQEIRALCEKLDIDPDHFNSPVKYYKPRNK